MSHKLGPTMVTVALIGCMTIVASATSARAADPTVGLPPVGTALVGGDSTPRNRRGQLLDGGHVQRAAHAEGGGRAGVELRRQPPRNLHPGTHESDRHGTVNARALERGRRVSIGRGHSDRPVVGVSACLVARWIAPRCRFGPDGWRLRTGSDRGCGPGRDRSAVDRAGWAKLAGPQPWSPDGSRLLIVTGAGLQVVAVGSGETTTLYPAQGRITAPASWSPDGSSVVFSPTATGEDVSPGLFIVRSDGMGLRSLTSGPDWFPSFSPLGKLVAFLRSPSGEEGPETSGSSAATAPAPTP